MIDPVVESPVDLAVVLGVRLGRNFVAGGDRLHLRFGETGSAGLVEIVERDAIEAVAGRADFLVDLKAALERPRGRRCRTGPGTTSARLRRQLRLGFGGDSERAAAERLRRRESAER